MLGRPGVPKGRRSWPSAPHAKFVAEKFCITVKHFHGKGEAIFVIQKTKGFGFIFRNKIGRQNA